MALNNSRNMNDSDNWLDVKVKRRNNEDWVDTVKSYGDKNSTKTTDGYAGDVELARKADSDYNTAVEAARSNDPLAYIFNKYNQAGNLESDGARKDAIGQAMKDYAKAMKIRGSILSSDEIMNAINNFNRNIGTSTTKEYRDWSMDGSVFDWLGHVFGQDKGTVVERNQLRGTKEIDSMRDTLIKDFEDIYNDDSELQSKLKAARAKSMAGAMSSQAILPMSTTQVNTAPVPAPSPNVAGVTVTEKSKSITPFASPSTMSMQTTDRNKSASSNANTTAGEGYEDNEETNPRKKALKSGLSLY